MAAFSLPRNAQIWLPGYAKSWSKARVQAAPKRVWLVLADHFEPLRGGVSCAKGQERIAPWQRLWPDIAARHTDSRGRPAQYTFFYPEEEYRPSLMDPLAAMARSGIADVEVHLHHDGEGQQNFVDRIGGFTQALHQQHGLLRKTNGQVRFGFIHGNWALDNSLPGGRLCGLNNEITLLRDLGCYADFTLPSAPSAAQTRIVNTIYWAADDPRRPKSHDVPAKTGRRDLLMIQGPLALNWNERSRNLFPRLEVGELADHNPVTLTRVRLWLRYAPRLGEDLFIKLFAHGALERNTEYLLQGGLQRMLGLIKAECGRLSAELRFVTAWEMSEAIGAVFRG